jgi:hypothetical protein
VKTIQEPVVRKASKYAIWQESARKDIERAFGVLQQKFHDLVRKREFWYLTNICSVVNICIMLHNMMVANRIESGDNESNAFYLYDATIDDNATTIEEAEQEHVNRRVAEMELHKNLYGINTDERLHRHNEDVANAATLKSLRFQYVQRRWECLYDAKEHRRLRNAILNQINS